MIYIMDGKTFIKEYCKREKKEDILDANIGIVSSTIRTKTNGEDSRVLPLRHLFPDSYLIMEFETYEENSYRDEYYNSLKKYLKLLSTIVKFSIEESDVIFLCGKREMKYNHLYILSDFITDAFKYPVIDYKKYIAGTHPKIVDIDVNLTTKIIEDIIGDEIDIEFNKVKLGKIKAKKFLNSLSKKELKKLAKKNDIIACGSKKDLIEDIKDYLEHHRR